MLLVNEHGREAVFKPITVWGEKWVVTGYNPQKAAVYVSRGMCHRVINIKETGLKLIERPRQSWKAD